MAPPRKTKFPKIPQTVGAEFKTKFRTMPESSDIAELMDDDSEGARSTREYIYFHNWSNPDSLVVSIVDVIESTPGISLNENESIGEKLDIESLEEFFQNSNRPKHDEPIEVRYPFDSATISIKDSGLIRVLFDRGDE